MTARTQEGVYVRSPWEAGRCRVPMWIMGAPAGLCGEPAIADQLPLPLLQRTRGGRDWPFCCGPCCPKHGGPREGEPIVFQDGYSEQGRPMWCAVMPDFVNLQESPAGFSADPVVAVEKLRAAIAPSDPMRDLVAAARRIEANIVLRETAEGRAICAALSRMGQQS